MRYRLVSFDFDGTLADSFPWFCAGLNDVAARYGFRAVAPDEIEALRSLSNREILARLRIPLWKLPLIARHMRKAAADSAAAIPLFPGVPALIEGLAASGAALAIISSNSEANVRTVLGPQLSARIAHFGCSASMFGKPAKLRRALKQLAVPAAAAIHVGDEDRDIRAARKAGLAAATVGWGYADSAALAAHGPDLHATTPEALLAALTA